MLALNKYYEGQKSVPHSVYIRDICEALFATGRPPEPQLKVTPPTESPAVLTPTKKRLKPDTPVHERTSAKHYMCDTRHSQASRGIRRRCVLCYHLDGKYVRTTTYCAYDKCGYFLCTDKGHWNMYHSDTPLQ